MPYASSSIFFETSLLGLVRVIEGMYGKRYIPGLSTRLHNCLCLEVENIRIILNRWKHRGLVCVAHCNYALFLPLHVMSNERLHPGTQQLLCCQRAWRMAFDKVLERRSWSTACNYCKGWACLFWGLLFSIFVPATPFCTHHYSNSVLSSLIHMASCNLYC